MTLTSGTLKIEIPIPRDGIEGALYGAFSSGGIAYWARVDARYTRLDGAKDGDLAPLQPRGRIVVVDAGNDGAHHTLDHAALLRGLALMAEVAPNQFGAIMTGAYDAITGDCLVQLSIFGELKYS